MAKLRVLLGPAGSAGDVHPFIPIGQRLRDRGHAVTVITSPYFEELIGRAGLDFAPVGNLEQLRGAMSDEGLWHPWRAFPTVFKFVGPMIREGYEVTSRLIEPNRTVLVGQWLGFGMRVAALAHDAPMATVHVQPAAMMSAHDLPGLPIPMPSWTPLWVRRGFVRLINRLTDRFVGPYVAPLLSELGLPPARNIATEWGVSRDLVLGLFPEWYAPPQPDWPEQAVLTGFPLYDESDVTATSPELGEYLAAGEPPVAFTPGSAHIQATTFFAEAARACELLGRRGIFLTRHAEQLPRPLPGCITHMNYVPFGRLLPRCAALVHHGGMGTTAQALRAGVPQLIMPMAFDQPDNARRVRGLGVGRSLRPRAFRARRVSEALQELIGDGEARRRCVEVAEMASRGDTVGIACDAIEALAGG